MDTKLPAVPPAFASDEPLTLVAGELMDPGPGEWYGLHWFKNEPPHAEERPDGGDPREQPVPYTELEDIAGELRWCNAVAHKGYSHAYDPTVVFAWCAQNNVRLADAVLARLTARWLKMYHGYPDCLTGGA